MEIFNLIPAWIWWLIYARLKDIDSKIKVGGWIAAGREVGQVGNSGAGSEPFLHYEVRHRARAINPLEAVVTGGESLGTN